MTSKNNNDKPKNGNLNIGSFNLDSWAPTQPIPLDDPYQEYLNQQHTLITDKLNFILASINLGDGDPFQSLMERTFVFGDHESHDFADAYDVFNGNLAVLGEAGIGKTVSLLLFARDMLLARLQDLAEPLVIYADARRWNAEKKPPLAYWLAAQIPLDPVSIRNIIKEDEPLFIIDGLDELTRKHALTTKSDKAIPNATQLFLDMFVGKGKIVVATTHDDFDSISDHPVLNGAVTLQPLTNQQIETYLSITDGTQALWKQIQASQRLNEILRLPLLLSMTVHGFAGNANKLAELQTKFEGEIRDAIFQNYVERHFQQQDKQPFPLEQVYKILGLAATRGVIRYGTGQVAMVQVNQPHWDDLLIIDDLRFGFMADDSHYGAEFMEFAESLHLIKRPENGMGSCTFVHTAIRDFLVVKHCLPLADKIDSYTVESLSRVGDERKYDVFYDILTGDFAPNHRLQAFVVLKLDKSHLSTVTLLRFSNVVTTDYFRTETNNVLSKRLASVDIAELKTLLKEIQGETAHRIIQEAISRKQK